MVDYVYNLITFGLQLYKHALFSVLFLLHDSNVVLLSRLEFDVARESRTKPKQDVSRSERLVRTAREMLRAPRRRVKHHVSGRCRRSPRPRQTF